KERFEIFFDEQLVMAPRVKQWYPIIRATAEEQEMQLMPLEPLFRDDVENMPLQAADMLAWLSRRESSGADHSFGWIPSKLPNITFSQYSQTVTKERMEKVTKLARGLWEKLTPEKIAWARKMLGLD